MSYNIAASQETIRDFALSPRQPTAPHDKDMQHCMMS